jgi:hypothetical protein
MQEKTPQNTDPNSLSADWLAAGDYARAGIQHVADELGVPALINHLLTKDVADQPLPADARPYTMLDSLDPGAADRALLTAAALREADLQAERQVFRSQLVPKVGFAALTDIAAVFGIGRR